MGALSVFGEIPPPLCSLLHKDFCLQDSGIIPSPPSGRYVIQVVEQVVNSNVVYATLWLHSL